MKDIKIFLKKEKEKKATAWWWMLQKSLRRLKTKFIEKHIIEWGKLLDYNYKEHWFKK